jgi:glutaredoxin
MKKIILLAVLLFGAYKLHAIGALDHMPYLNKLGLKNPGAFDADGKAMVRLFVGPGCEAVCGDIESLLQSRKIDYTRVDIATPEGAQYAVQRYPLLQVGHDSAVGGKFEIIGALARNLGPAVLSSSERLAMQNHFDDQGRAIVVLYGTEWCAFCKKQRAYFASHDIPFIEFDPEKSEAARTAYTRLQGNGYPLTYVGYQRFDGYHEGEIKDAVAAIR